MFRSGSLLPPTIFSPARLPVGVPARRWIQQASPRHAVSHVGLARTVLKASTAGPLSGTKGTRILYGSVSGHSRHFHTSPRAEGLPFVGAGLLAALKTSGSIEVARTVGRVTLSLAGILFLKNMKTKKKIQHVDKYADKHAAAGHTDKLAELATKRENMLKSMRARTILFHATLFAPMLLFWLAIAASMERTPLTGRWRSILLSPDEEDDISSQLSNGGWHTAVKEIVSQNGAPAQLVPSTDWRYRWTLDVLRRLEGALQVLGQEIGDDWITEDPSGNPVPPPPPYPLRASPRASEYIRSMCEAMVNRHVPPARHAVTGAPYNLVVVDDPCASNAFSYGFGPEGAGGIVVYSGFIDEILSRTPPPDAPAPEPTPSPSRSWLHLITGGFSASSAVPMQQSPQPTAEQTSELAILLAHELAHLILAHHLETLSSGTIIVPGFLSLATDLVRVILFPITMIFGPFVNDALANVGRASSVDFAAIGERCTSVPQEVEADIVSLRLLAYAGFDARDAVGFWEHRAQQPISECSSSRTDHGHSSPASALSRKISGDDHPLVETRVLRIREELQLWEEQRRAEAEQRRALESAETPS